MWNWLVYGAVILKITVLLPEWPGSPELQYIWLARPWIASENLYLIFTYSKDHN